MTGLIILAAGQSRRFGQPKQNLLFQNQTLLQRAIETAVASECRPIIVITGANDHLIDLPNPNPDVTIICNSGWEEGMSSSIRMGIKKMENHNDVDSALMMLCDQPLVTPLLLNEMLRIKQITGKAIVACTYDETIGVPALFDRRLFTELLLLNGDEGAKKVLASNADKISVVSFPDGGMDIDTSGDYYKLTKKYNH